jgi:hypothetical protein
LDDIGKFSDLAPLDPKASFMFVVTPAKTKRFNPEKRRGFGEVYLYGSVRQSRRKKHFDSQRLTSRKKKIDKNVLSSPFEV